MQTRIAELEARRTTLGDKPKEFYDPQNPASITAVITSVLLVIGHYKLIEWSTTTLVAAFTFTTICTVIALQFTDFWAITWTDLANGFRFACRQRRKQEATKRWPLLARRSALLAFVHPNWFRIRIGVWKRDMLATPALATTRPPGANEPVAG